MLPPIVYVLAVPSVGQILMVNGISCLDVKASGWRRATEDADEVLQALQEIGCLVKNKSRIKL